MSNICLDPLSKVHCNFESHVNAKKKVSVQIYLFFKILYQHLTLNFEKKTQTLLST